VLTSLHHLIDREWMHISEYGGILVLLAFKEIIDTGTVAEILPFVEAEIRRLKFELRHGDLKVWHRGVHEMSDTELLKCSLGESEPNPQESEKDEANSLQVEPNPSGEPAMPEPGSKPRGRPFAPGKSGNPNGRPKGARNKATLAAEALLDGESETLTRKLIDKAKEGDIGALRFCIDRICPPRRNRLVTVEIPEIKSLQDADRAAAAVLAACAGGEISTGEAPTSWASW
jgi:hypothetical protein